MERCVFCQAELDAETRFCWQCGRARSSMLLSEDTAPSLASVPPARRCAVCGALVPAGASVCGNCLSDQPLAEVIPPVRETSPDAPLKRCVACGEESPIWARFCGACRQPFALPADDPAELTQAGLMTEASETLAASSAAPRITRRLLSGALAGPSESFTEGNDAPTLVPTPAALDLDTSSWEPIEATPPPEQASQPSRPKLDKLRIKIIAAILVTALVTTAGGATLAYFLTRPEPTIQVSSTFFAGKTPAASPTTTLRIVGKNFSHHSSVAILLDGKPAPGVQHVPTDGLGGFSVSVTVTEAWRFGAHTLTATDSRGYTTTRGAAVQIIPRPVISVQSKYQQDGVPAGAATTTLHISGKWFSYNSPITFLLDGRPAPGSQGIKSDANGRVDTDLTVTGDWGLGNHTLTAKDAQGYTTQSGVPLAIVPQGEASTPGPNGAPSDNASFTLAVTVQTQDPITGQPASLQETLTIAGGTVCQARDNGQPYTQTGSVLDATGQPTGITYQETLTSTCSGSYKGGQLTYTETVTSDQYSLSNGLTCQAGTPYTLQSLNGSFSSATNSGGNWNTSGVIVICLGGLPFTSHPAQQGSWSGTVQ